MTERFQCFQGFRVSVVQGKCEGKNRIPRDGAAVAKLRRVKRGLMDDLLTGWCGCNSQERRRYVPEQARRPG